MTDIAEIQAALAADGTASWVAADTEFLRSSASGVNTIGFGLRLLDDSGARFSAASAPGFEDLANQPPRSIDWRTKDGGRVSPVRFQGSCGSCVAFAVVAAMESALLITAGDRMLLSEGHLFYCNGGSCIDGWDFGPALEAAKNNGVGLALDFPYKPFGACKAVAPRARVSSWRVHSTTSDRKRALTRGPVIGGMKVFADFLAYQSGVYRHVIGGVEGNHAICLVGYDDDAQCWIAKNSWSDRFGEGGFFRIAYGQCDLDNHPFYSVECVIMPEAAA